MADLLLTRLAMTERGTIGLLEGGGVELWTIEQPWRENRPFQSCVPLGRYKLIPHDSEKFPGTYALIGGTVSYGPSSEHERYGILMHIANTMDDVSGCIGVGVTAGWLNHLPGVYRSAVGLERLRAALGRTESHYIAIRQAGLAF